MKSVRYLLLALALLCQFAALANVQFQFSAGTIDAGQTKTSMERNISALLTEVNRAASTGSALNLSNIAMEPNAKERLKSFWNKAARFECKKERYITKCLNDVQGYQVRAIGVTMKPVDSTYDGSLNRELTISLNRQGVITGVRPTWEIQEDVNKLLTESAGGVADSRQRREILKWVEDFRCYYNEKNLPALKQIYSDDALIITGSVVQRKSRGADGVKMDSEVRYKVQNKEQYLAGLKNLFANTGRINVGFDHISVVSHPAKANIYGVTLHQNWKTDNYMDDGWLFLLWDFTDEEHPQIHVRTWQKDNVAAKDGVFTLDDFFIP